MSEPSRNEGAELHATAREERPHPPERAEALLEPGACRLDGADHREDGGDHRNRHEKDEGQWVGVSLHDPDRFGETDAADHVVVVRGCVGGAGD